MGLPLRLRGAKKPDPLAAILARPAVEEALRSFSRDRAWINERHLAVCRVPAPTFFEAKRAEWMAAELAALGCTVEMDRVGNVVAYPFGKSQRSLIAITAHLDTVLSPRTEDDIRVAPDGRFLGPGIADNGAGLAALIALAAAFRSLRDDWDDALHAPVLVANICEEGEGNLSGMRYLCRQSPLAGRIRRFLVLDGPGTDHITSHALGSRRFEISFAGPGGHSWSDSAHGNPVHALASAIADFTSGPARNGGPRCSINFGLIEGGASINSIPSEARTKLDLRSESQERLDELAELLVDAVERALASENERVAGMIGRDRSRTAREQARVSAKVREIGSRPGGSVPASAEILAAIRAVDEKLNIRSAIDCASTDANIPISMGLEAVSIGAGGLGGGAHTPGEWFHPEGRETGLERVLLTACVLSERA